MTQQIYNFSAGPATLPLSVFQKVQNELLNYQNTGMSVMELSHRGTAFTEIISAASSLLRKLMHIPDNYKILFYPGGASMHFALVPMNFATNKIAAYADTGLWSYKAIQEAKKSIQVQTITSSRENNYNYIPQIVKENIIDKADYLHITTNNTIYGTQYKELPNVGNTPLIADMSSDILSKEYDVSKFGMIYAGAQKNLGPSGLSICIIREDLLELCPVNIPSIFNYRTIAENQSLYNTPPTFAIYVCKLVLEWLKVQGGVQAIEKINKEKAALLYGFLDNAALFKATIPLPFRSMMNVPFTTGNEKLDELFIQEATANGLMQLKGHRTVGGMRASIYNAMSIDGVKKLIALMQNFEMQNK